MMFLLLITIISISIATDSNVTPSPQCPVNPALCMIDLLKLWEELRLKETGAAKVLLPVVYYSKDSLIRLCEGYSDIANKCMLETCHVDDTIASFVNRHLSFVCKPEFVMEKFANQECIATTLMGSNCSVFINEEPQIGGEMFCPKLEEFQTCVEKPLKVSCRIDAFPFLKKLVANYGCSFGSEVNQLSSTEMASSTGVLTDNPPISVKLESLLKNDEDGKNSFTTTTLDVENELAPPFKIQKSTDFLNDRTTTSHKQQDNGISTFSEFVEVKPNKQENEALEGSGEIPMADSVKILELQNDVHSATVTANPSIIANNHNSGNMTDCYTSIVGDFGRYLHSSPTASFVRFPLFGIKPMELEVLCAKFEVATRCVENLCIGNCRLPPIKSFVDSQLKETCMLRETSDFMMEFICLQNVLKEKTECVTFLNSTNPNRCNGHPQFRSCIVNHLIEDCSEKTVHLMEKMQSGFGCKTLVGEEHKDEIEGSGETVEGSGSTDVHQFIEQNNKENNQASGSMADDGLLTDDLERTHENCEEKMKTSALSCLAPLLRLWTGIKDNRKDTEVVFPVFEFSKIELLELCDAFANYRNCVRHKNTSSCKSEPVISFAEEHFGQICTTQQIEASMKTHDCINSINISEMALCQKFSKGETLPGKRKCSKVRRYTRCVRKLVSKLCGHLLLAQFDMIVNRFGCEF